MTLWNLVMFIVNLPGLPARVLEQVDNSVFHEMFTAHGFVLFAPTILFFYLVYQVVLETEDTVGNEHFMFQEKYIQLIILVLSICALNSNHYLVDRSSTEYLISRSTHPDRVDSILKECNVKIRSTKIYIFWWKTFPTPGHMSAQLFDENMTYLSRWPGGVGVNFRNPTAIKKPLPVAYNDSPNDDIVDEEKKPDYIIIIPQGILKDENIHAVAEWFESLNGDLAGIYKGKFKNCADLIKQALKIGKFHLANPSLRWLKLGLSIPNDIADRIVYTICLQLASHLIRILHHILTIIVWMITMNFSVIFLCFIRSCIPNWMWQFLLPGLWLIPYHLFYATR